MHLRRHNNTTKHESLCFWRFEYLLYPNYELHGFVIIFTNKGDWQHFIYQRKPYIGVSYDGEAKRKLLGYISGIRRSTAQMYLPHILNQERRMIKLLLLLCYKYWWLLIFECYVSDNKLCQMLHMHGSFNDLASSSLKSKLPQC